MPEYPRHAVLAGERFNFRGVTPNGKNRPYRSVGAVPSHTCHLSPISSSHTLVRSAWGGMHSRTTRTANMSTGDNVIAPASRARKKEEFRC
eukprot:SAG25_NODE_322_length_9886_cov_11.794217_12_plen_91_part_00